MKKVMRGMIAMAATAMLIAGTGFNAMAADDPKPAAPAAAPAAGARPPAGPSAIVGGAPGAEVLKYKMKDINGKEMDLAQYKGKVVMIVNVASKCGFTPQYAQLEAIQEKYAAKGFTVIGFPANDFRSQEPGTDAEIKDFCESTYHVKFPIMSKISVKDPEKAQIYKDLTAKESNGQFAGEIEWNFTKFIVGKDGKVVARYKSAVKPDAPEVVSVLEAELAKK